MARSDGVQAATALKRVGVRGAARRQCFRLRKIELKLFAKNTGFSDASSRPTAVIIRIAIIFRREIAFRAQCLARHFAISSTGNGLQVWGTGRPQIQDELMVRRQRVR